MLKALYQSAVLSVKELWHSLDPKLQTAIVAFTSAAATSFGDAVFTAGSGFWHLSVIKHTLGAAATAGVGALRIFWMRPGPGPKELPPISGS